MNTYYLAHHGITGMKWGVWNEETRRKRMGGTSRSASRAKRIEKQLSKASTEKNAAKAEKRIKKAAYLQELDSPGSTNLDTKFLNRKRLKNIGATCYSGYAAVSNILSAATGPAAIPLYSAAWGPIAGPAIGVGLSAFNAAAAAGWTKLALDSIERASGLHNSISNRKDSNQKTQRSNGLDRKKSTETKNATDKQSKMQRAEKDGMYDVGFMDAIQSTQMFYNEDWNSINKAYSKYLDDPQGFWKTRSRYKQAD